MMSVWLHLALAAATPFELVAEKTGFVETGRYAEVEALCVSIPKAHPGRVKCETFGTTPEGRKMLVFIASDDGVFTAGQAQAKKRPILLAQGAIHAGEADGKEAGFQALRSLLFEPKGGLLSRVTFVFVPVFNVDGHERRSSANRPNQIGPKEPGWRVTAQNLNLNRDYAKAEAPEMAAMLTLLRKFDPIVYVDLHVTDGAKFQHDISVMIEPRFSGNAELRTHGVALLKEVMGHLHAHHHLPVDFYPQFNEDDVPASGFSNGVAPPRFSASYWALNNRIGVLVEAHSWKTFAERVSATRDALMGLLLSTAAHGLAWRSAAQAADDADRKRDGGEVAIEFDTTKKSEPVEFLGYAYSREDSGVSGKVWVRYDETRPEVWKVPLFSEVIPTATASLPPAGYLVPPAHAAWVSAKLTLHGFSFSVLKTAQDVPVAGVFRVTDAKFKPAPYEGRQVVTASGAWNSEPVALKPGSLFVPSSQPHAALLVHLFEPTARDSFFSWGFFNAHLEQKEYMEDYVAEDVARAMLADGGVRVEFERLLRDAGFSKDPSARLRFFYERHPSFDREWNRYPVLRLERAPTP